MQKHVDEMRRLNMKLATLPTEAQFRQQAEESHELKEKIEIFEGQNRQTTKFLAENDIKIFRKQIAEKRTSIQQLQTNRQAEEDALQNKTPQARKSRSRRKSAMVIVI